MTENKKDKDLESISAYIRGAGNAYDIDPPKSPPFTPGPQLGSEEGLWCPHCDHFMEPDDALKYAIVRHTYTIENKLKKHVIQCPACKNLIYITNAEVTLYSFVTARFEDLGLALLDDTLTPGRVRHEDA